MKRLPPILLVGWLAVVLPACGNGGEEFPFHVGEKLTYQIYWGPFVAGRATLEVVGLEDVDGHECYHLVAKARTSGLADVLFHVESKTESWMDTKQLFTRRYRQRRVEGKHQRADETRYDYAGGQLVTTNFFNGKQKTTPLDGPAQDMVSSLYYVRTQPLKIDAENKFQVNLAGNKYDVTVRPDERKTMFFRPTGNVPALRIEPTPTLTIVASNKGRMWFWVSDDERKLPLLLASEMKIGSARFVLAEVESANPALDKELKKVAATNTPPVPPR